MTTTLSSMKRYVLASRGDLSGIKLERSAPVPKITSATQILIRIRAISLNARDLQIALNKYPAPHAIPVGVVPVSDGCGEVVEVGAAVERFAIGDKASPVVFTGHHFEEDPPLSGFDLSLGGGIDGLASEYFLCDQADAVKIPDYMSYEQGSTLTIAYSTAWSSLYSHAHKLQAGQTVLCLGTGGVSLAAAQIALAAGARVVLTSSSRTKLDRAVEVLEPLVRGRGRADMVQTVDYSTHQIWDEEVRRVTDGRGVDFVVEIGGRGTLGRSLRSTRRGGFVAISGYLTNYAELPQDVLDEDIAQQILYSAANVRGVFVASRAEEENMIRAMELAGVEPIIDKVFDFDQLKEAYQYMADGKHFGKVVVRV